MFYSICYSFFGFLFSSSSLFYYNKLVFCHHDLLFCFLHPWYTYDVRIVYMCCFIMCSGIFKYYKCDVPPSYLNVQIVPMRCLRYSFGCSSHIHVMFSFIFPILRGFYFIFVFPYVLFNLLIKYCLFKLFIFSIYPYHLLFLCFLLFL